MTEIYIHSADGFTGANRRLLLYNRLRTVAPNLLSGNYESFASNEFEDADSSLRLVETSGEWLIIKFDGIADYETRLRIADALGAVVDEDEFDWGVSGSSPPSGEPTIRDVGEIVAVSDVLLEEIGRDQLLAAPGFAAFERSNSIALVITLNGDSSRIEALEAHLSESNSNGVDYSEPVSLDTVPNVDDDPIELLDAVGRWPRQDVAMAVSTTKSVDALVLRSADDDWPRDAMTEVVSNFTEATSRLVALFEDKRKPVRREALWAIDSLYRDVIDSTQYFEQLRGLAENDPDPEIRRKALEVARDRVIGYCDDEIATTVGSLGASVVLDEPEPEVRLSALKTVRDALDGTTHRGELLSTLREVYKTDEDPEIRAEALWIVVVSDDDAGLLFEALESNTQEVRSKAASALEGQADLSTVGLGSPRMFDRIAEYADEIHRARRAEDDNVRAAATRALGVIGEDVETDTLIEVLRSDPDESTRQAAAKVLGQIGDRAVLQQLVKALEDDSAQVRRDAADSIGTIYRAGVDGEPPVDPVPQLLEMLTTEEQILSSNRTSAAKALGAIGDDRAVQPLLRALEDDRIAAFKGLTSLGTIGEAAFEPLRKRIVAACDGDADLPVGASARGIAETGDERAVGLLRTAYDCDRFDEGAYEEVGKALGQTGGKRAIEPLISGLETGRGGGVEGLGEVGTPAVDPLISMLDEYDNNDEVYERTLEALGRTGDPQAIEFLLRKLPSAKPSVAVAICDGLGHAADERLVPVFQGLSRRSPEEEIRERANNARGVLRIDLKKKAFQKRGVRL